MSEEKDVDIPEVQVDNQLEAFGMIIGLLIEIRDELRRGNMAEFGEDLGMLP